jgi:hypothetical protein
MNEFFNSISTREISLLFWGFLFLGTILVLSKGYKDLGYLIKLIFSKILIYCYIFIGLYISLIYFLLKKTIFWDSYLIKDFVLWCIGFALVSLFNSNSVNSNLRAFTKFKNIFSLTIFADFFINFFTFELWWELIFIPIVSFIGILKIFTDLNIEKEGYSRVNKFLKELLSIIGIFLFAYCSYRLYYNYNEIIDNKSVKSFLLPVILSVLYFPVILFLASFHRYQTLFNILNRSLFISYKRKREIKTAVILYGNINIDKLNKIESWDKNELKNNTNIFDYIKFISEY